MIKLRFSLLMALLVVAVSVFADNAPAKVQTALKKMYPKRSEEHTSELQSRE